MIQTVTVTNNRFGETWAATQTEVFTLRKLPTDRYHVRDIQGLGPVNASIATSNNVYVDGVTPQNMLVGARNIVLQLGFNPNYATNQTVQDLRNRLLKLMPVKDRVTLTFVTSGLPEVKIDGIVETHEPSIFTQDPEVTISLICPDPYFQLAAGEQIREARQDGLTISEKGRVEINYPGSVPVGFVAEFTVPKDTGVVHFAAMFRDARVSNMVINYGFKAGDKIKIDTRKGSRVVLLNNLPVTTKITAAMTPTSPWVQLEPWVTSTVNFLRARFDDPDVVGAMQPIMDTKVTYLPKFGGL